MSMDPLNLESETRALESEMVALGIDEGKKKKKTRSKPGRHWQIKARVELRTKWEAEKRSKHFLSCFSSYARKPTIQGCNAR